MELDELIPVEQFFEDYVTRLQTSAVTEDRNPYGWFISCFPTASSTALFSKFSDWWCPSPTVKYST